MRQDLAGPLARWFAPWHEAWRGLADNPLATVLRQAQLRSQRAVPWWKQHAFALVMLVIAAVIATVVVSLTVANLIAAGSSLQDTITAIEQLAPWLLALLVIPVYSAWLLEGVFSAVVDALSVLGFQTRGRYRLALDDMLAITALGDREIVLGALVNLLPPLLLRVAVGAVLAPLTVLVIVAAGNLSNKPAYLLDTKMLDAISAAPFSLILIFIHGSLAALCGLLYMLAMGRGLQTGNVTTSAGVITSLAQLALIPTTLGVSMALNADYGMLDRSPEALFTMLLLVLVAAPLTLWVALHGAQASRALRYVLAVGTAPVVIALFAIAAALGASIFSDLFNDEATGILFMGGIMSWFSLATVNLTPLDFTIFAAYSDDIGTSSVGGWLATQIAVLLLAQGSLAVLLSEFAASAVRIRRHQAD